MNYFNKNFINFCVITFVLLIGSFIAVNRGSNFSDGDSYSIILSFLKYLDLGIYEPSRNYGHPIPELVIGSFAYFFGTPFSNLICFLCFFASTIILFFTFIKKNNNLYLFVLLCSSNFYLLFENTNSVDFPIALLFFSLGFFFLKKKYLIISAIFFGLCIASRANFLVFIYPSLFIYYYDNIINKKFYDFVKVLVISIFVGILFYYPVFKTNDYSLKFLDLPFIENTTESGWYGGPDIKFELLFPRFVFKIYKLTGVFASIIILFFYKEIIKYMISLNKLTLISCYVIFVNLIIFYFMPTKMLIINPFLLFLYLIIFNSLNKKKIILIILLNLLPWFLSYNILDIKYKNQELCYAKEAIDASFSFSISEGNLIEYMNSNSKLGKCYSTFMGKYYLEFENGLPLRLSK